MKNLKSSLLGYFILIIAAFLVPLSKQTLAITNTINTPFLVSQNFNSDQLLAQGKTSYNQGKYREAIELWQRALSGYQNSGLKLNQAQIFNYLSLSYQALGDWNNAQSSLDQSFKLLESLGFLDQVGRGIYAQALNNQGAIFLEMGKTQSALEIWQKAEKIYQEINQDAGIFGSRLNQAQALQNLGQYRRAKTVLEDLVKSLQEQPDSIFKANSLRSLAIALQTIGDPQQSKLILDQSRLISENLNDLESLSHTLFSIGNIARDLQEYEIAYEYYNTAINITENPLTKLQAQLNLFSLLIDLKEWELAQDVLPLVITNLNNLTPSRQVIYGRINLAENLMKSAQNDQAWVNLSEVINLLVAGVNDSRLLEDPRAQAYSLNQLAQLYETQQQWEQTQQLTQQTLALAQTINSGELQAIAGWRLGRIYQQQGNRTEAIAYYDLAFEKMQSLRSDLVAINPEIQVAFQDKIEPLYREYMGLLLNKSEDLEKETTQRELNKTLKVMEALQLAELDNFFRDACLDSKPVNLEQIDTQGAVIHPIILDDRLEVILSLPNQKLKHHRINLNKIEIETKLKQLYSSLYLGYSQKERLKLSKEVYDWLIQPVEKELEQSQIKTIVFILDGFLRNLPMAVLHDGEKYLIEKYSLALSPGLQLFPQGLPQQGFRALTVGLTEARQGFNELPAVEQEIIQISQQINSQVLLNQGFTTESFSSKMERESFQVVHLATHGQFSSDPDHTFLLTWDGKITIDQLEKLFEKRRFGILPPIELLVLSACQTALGDSRATLGLAGLALSSGAKSTLASLWSVNDQSTADLMTEFYQQLSRSDRKLTKAEALRQAQLSLLRNPLYNHPYYWASFVLIGNWL